MGLLLGEALEHRMLWEGQKPGDRSLTGTTFRTLPNGLPASWAPHALGRDTGCSVPSTEGSRERAKSGRGSHEGSKGLGQAGTLGLSWLPEGFQQGVPLRLLPQPLPLWPQHPSSAPAPPQASPPKVFGWRHPPTQVHPLLELAHGALALGNLVGVGMWGEARPASPTL